MHTALQQQPNVLCWLPSTPAGLPLLVCCASALQQQLTLSLSLPFDSYVLGLSEQLHRVF
jgi:hypothetical protein